MKKLIGIVALAGLAACSQGVDDNTANQATADVVAVDADNSAVDATPADEVVTSEGVEEKNPTIVAGVYGFEFDNNWAPTVLTLNEDGTYTETGAAIQNKSGTWTQPDGNLCKSGDNEECWVKDVRQADGVIVVSREGVTARLTRRT